MEGLRVEAANVWRYSSSNGAAFNSKLTHLLDHIQHHFQSWLQPLLSVNKSSKCPLLTLALNPTIDQTKRHWQVPCAHLKRRLVCETSLSIPSARSCKTGKRMRSHPFYKPGNKLTISFQHPLPSLRHHRTRAQVLLALP